MREKCHKKDAAWAAKQHEIEISRWFHLFWWCLTNGHGKPNSMKMDHGTFWQTDISVALEDGHSMFNHLRSYLVWWWRVKKDPTYRGADTWIRPGEIGIESSYMGIWAEWNIPIELRSVKYSQIYQESLWIMVRNGYSSASFGDDPKQIPMEKHGRWESLWMHPKCIVFNGKPYEHGWCRGTPQFSLSFVA